jgi:hypothetical protein
LPGRQIVCGTIVPAKFATRWRPFPAIILNKY